MAKKVSIPDGLLDRGVDQIQIKKELEAKLLSGHKLRIKHGVDPTTDKLHIGYGVVYWKLREFQELGHKIIFLIGDFTARFGDPSDKSMTRQMRTKAQVDKLAEAYLDQVSKILDLKKTEIRRNSEWYDKMSAEDLLRLASQFTVAQMLERDMFVTRTEENRPIGLHEPMYPVLQGYDSVCLKSDLTIVGTDQLFNELMARPLQTRADQVPQDVMAMSLLIGTDGKAKMSQSLGNDIGITDSPQEQFGKVLSIPDGLINHYYELATLASPAKCRAIARDLELGVLKPRDAKLALAKEIVTLYHGKEAGNQAQAEFLRVFSQRELPSEIEARTVAVKRHRLDGLLLEIGLASSRSEAQRLIKAGAVKIDSALIGDWQAEIALHDEMIVQVGKRGFRKIKLEASH